MSDSVSTAEQQLAVARERLRSAEDVEWNDPTKENARLATFWAGQVAELSAMNGSMLIPLF